MGTVGGRFGRPLTGTVEPVGRIPARTPVDRVAGCSCGSQKCGSLIASEGTNYCTHFDGPKPPKYRRGQCDSRLHDTSEEATPLGQCPRPIPTRRGVPGNRGVSELEGKAQPTCQPPRRGEARGRSDGFNPKPRYVRSPEVASTAMLGTERGGLLLPRGGHLSPGVENEPTPTASRSCGTK